MSAIRCEHLHVGIDGQDLIRDLSFKADSGQCWGILGANGCGKSTLLYTLAGLHPAAAGEVFINDIAMHRLGRRQIAQQLGILLQEHEEHFPATVLENVLTGRHPHIPLWQWESDSDIEIARQALDELGLGELAHRHLHTLSGGERRRVDIARLITQQAAILLLDEPTNHLDLHHQISILERLTRQARQEQRCLMMVLHDINLAARFCDHLLLFLRDGRVLHGRREELLLAEHLEQLYDYPVRIITEGGHTAYLPA